MNETKSPKKLKKILLILLGIILAGIAVLIATRAVVLLSAPKEFMVTSDNYFDYQRRYECSGYASAYVIRSLGGEADGLSLYESFTDKNPDGTLAPGYLWENLRANGYKSSLCIGGVADLKYQVSRGAPVVVLIRVNTYEPYLHYVPVVGYDEEYFYIADSLSTMVNAEDEHYNRRVTVDEFKELWKNNTFAVDNIYITIGIR